LLLVLLPLLRPGPARSAQCPQAPHRLPHRRVAVGVGLVFGELPLGAFPFGSAALRAPWALVGLLDDRLNLPAAPAATEAQLANRHRL